MQSACTHTMRTHNMWRHPQTHPPCAQTHNPQPTLTYNEHTQHTTDTMPCTHTHHTTGASVCQGPPTHTHHHTLLSPNPSTQATRRPHRPPPAPFTPSSPPHTNTNTVSLQLHRRQEVRRVNRLLAANPHPLVSAGAPPPPTHSSLLSPPLTPRIAELDLTSELPRPSHSSHPPLSPLPSPHAHYPPP